MENSTLTRFLFALLFVLPCGAVHAMPELPASMVFVGRITAGLDAPSPRAGDQVLAFSAVDGQFVGSGVVSTGGDYAAVITRTPSFNGTPLVFELVQGRYRYLLLPEGPALAPPLRFRGRTLPQHTPLALRVGIKTAELAPGELENPRAQRLGRRPELPCSQELDVDGDGRCDQRDWDILLLYGGGITRSVAHPD